MKLWGMPVPTPPQNKPISVMQIKLICTILSHYKFFFLNQPWNHWNLLQLDRIFPRFIHTIAGISTSFFLLLNILLYGYSLFCLSIHQLVDFWIVSTLDFYELWCYEYSFKGFWIDICFSLEYIPKSRISGSCGSSMFDILKNW